MPLSFDRFFEGTVKTPIARHHESLREALSRVRKHGRSEEWDQVLACLDVEPTSVFDFSADTVMIGERIDLPIVESILKALMPWRKGPFDILGAFVDTEWRSDWKWRRIKPHLLPLDDKLVLDVGCGNGYHMFRMLGDGARLVVGVDPTMVFNYQFTLMQQLITENNAYLLPLRSEELPSFACFDTVFSLGVLYHRKSPIDHLAELASFLKPGGQLVLETLVVDGDEHRVLIPEDRYASMGNVWFIPSTLFLERMLRRVGFNDVQTVDVTVTTIEEQRATEWMDFQSLTDFLDPDDHTKTIEGYPAPTRAILVARK